MVLVGPTSNTGTHSSATTGGGGGSGGYSLYTIPVVEAQVYTVNVGGSVAAGTGNGNAKQGFDSFVTGSNPLATEVGRAQTGRGGLTSVFVAASTPSTHGVGGAGGTANNTMGATGGTAASSTISGKGANGIMPIAGDTPALGGAAVDNDAPDGNGSTKGASFGNQTGLPGQGIGSGGSGAIGNMANLSSARSGRAGGVGGQGRIIFTYSTATLPVSLISFNASASNNQAKLSWSTASEARNDRFEVQRSSDNVTYVTVATVKGNGTTSQKSTYTAYDANQQTV